MTRSMTAFAQAQNRGVSWEIRSVNQRFTDINFRMSESHRRLELKLREKIKQQVQRGKLDCTLRIEGQPSEALEINQALVGQLVGAVNAIDRQTGSQTPLNALELLRWPGVTEEPDTDQESLNALILETFDDCLAQLIEMRTIEGQNLAQLLRDQIQQLHTIVQDIKRATPELAAAQQQKIRDRVAALATEVNQDRLEQELAFIAQKGDIQEEIDRLEGHMTQVIETLNETNAVGRRLDFLMQELNREANTLGAKVSAVSTSLQAVDLKVVIEQMREQVQNIE